MLWRHTTHKLCKYTMYASWRGGLENISQESQFFQLKGMQARKTSNMPYCSHNAGKNWGNTVVLFHGQFQTIIWRTGGTILFMVDFTERTINKDIDGNELGGMKTDKNKSEKFYKTPARPRYVSMTTDHATHGIIRVVLGLGRGGFTSDKSCMISRPKFTACLLNDCLI